MHLAFVTFGNYTNYPTLKRATGMARPLIEAGHRVSILLEDTLDNRAKVASECPKAEVIYHDRSPSVLSERAQKEATLKRIKPDCVWVCAVGARTWVRRPHEGCIMIADHSELPSAFVKKPLRKIYEYTCEWGHLWAFDAHVCASRYLENFYAKRLLRVGKSPRVHYSPYAFNQLLLQQEPFALPILQANYTYPKTVVYMGAFWENYGFWDMLHVFRELLSERGDLQFLMLGKGPEKEDGIRWIEKHGLGDRIHLVGYAPEEELSSYFHFGDVFICPLRRTIQDIARCPSKIYMYLAFQKPIVTSPIGEAVEVFGNDGFYYEPGERKDLKRALSGALTTPDSRKLPEAYEHNWQARADTFLRWFNQNFPQL